MIKYSECGILIFHRGNNQLSLNGLVLAQKKSPFELKAPHINHSSRMESLCWWGREVGFLSQKNSDTSNNQKLFMAGNMKYRYLQQTTKVTPWKYRSKLRAVRKSAGGCFLQIEGTLLMCRYRYNCVKHGCTHFLRASWYTKRKTASISIQNMQVTGLPADFQ